MLSDWTQLLLPGAILIVGGFFIYLQLRHRVQATKGIESLADLRAGFSEKPYTVVQLFAPL